MKQDMLLMEHPEIDGRGTSTRKAFDEVWADKGWVEIDPESGEPILATDVTADDDADESPEDSDPFTPDQEK